MTLPNADPPSETQAARLLRPLSWRGFVARHLHDYNLAARRRWLALVTAGGLSTLVALVCLIAGFDRGASQALLAVASLALVAVVAGFPVQIPRTKYSISVADVVVFALLALQGLPLAIAAAAIEGLVGAVRSSKRWSSRLSTPSAAAFAMAICGLLFEQLRPVLVLLGISSAQAQLVALCAVALPYFALCSLPLISVVSAKTGQRVSLRHWLENYSWHGAIYLVSAAVAGAVAMNIHYFGTTMAVVAGVLALILLGLVNVSIKAHEKELDRHDAQLDSAQREAEHNQRRFTAAFTHAAIGMAIVRSDGRVHQVNRALCELLGRQDNELVGDRFESLLHAADVVLFRRHALETTANSGSIELRCCAGDGGEIWVSLHCSRFADPGAGGDSMVYQLHDISSRRRAEGKLHHIAYHDDLTDLANRNGFNERLQVAVERARVDPEQRFAVFFLDLDRFKVVNDSLGHAAGNEMLMKVARRLVDNVRPSDLVARLGGDEFAVLLDKLCEREPTLALAERLLLVLAEPMRINGTEVIPSASIGITFGDMDYRSADEVLRDADLAMYAAKADGRRRVVLFDQSMHERIAEKLRLEGDLRRAIGEGQLSLVYQPLYDLSPYRLSGFEALARWVHPERGPISPEVFITLAEESGHIEALTAWVVERAVGQLTQWRASFADGALLDMHVNISGRDLSNAALVPMVREVLQRHALPPHCLTLEITETTLMGKLSVALDTLHALREVGCKFSIDDFGTGYSSLAYLSTLPIDSLKIDRSFVMGIGSKSQAIEIIRAIMNLANSLGKKVVAEGIETPAQLAALKQLGVHVGQGYLLARPMPAHDVEPLLAAPVPEPA